MDTVLMLGAVMMSVLFKHICVLQPLAGQHIIYIICTPSAYTQLLAFVLHPIPHIYTKHVIPCIPYIPYIPCIPYLIYVCTMHVCIIAYSTPVCWGAAGLGSKGVTALGSSHMDERHLPLLCCKSSSFCMHCIHESNLLHDTPQPC